MLKKYINTISIKKVVFIIGIIAVVVLGLFTTSNIDRNIDIESDKISVVTTLFPLYDFTKEVGGDKVNVTLLLPPGVESHSFEPKPSDIITINESDVFVYTGKYMEMWAEDIVQGLTNKSVTVIDSSTGIELMKETEESDEIGLTAVEPELFEHNHHDGLDPHIWLGLNNAQVMVETIANALITKDPANADYYRKNANEYKTRLVQLDEQYRAGITQCDSKEIVYGGHYAFGYMANRYGLTYTSAQGFSPDSEPTVNNLIGMVEQIRSGNIKYVFYEELASPKIAETLANETDAKLLLLNGAHNIAKGDLEKNMSFISIMEENLVNLKTGLGCK